MNDENSPIALVLADRGGSELGALCRDTCPAMLPIAGKHVLQHTLEFLARAGIREVIVAVSAFADQVDALVGRGERWGLTLETSVTRGEIDPGEFVRRHSRHEARARVVLRGDVLRNVDPADLAAIVKRSGTSCRLSGDDDLMLDVLPAASESSPGDLDNLSWPPGVSSLPEIDMPNARLYPLSNHGEFHRASLAVARGDTEHVTVDGRSVSPGVFTGIGARFSPASVRGKHVFIGRDCDIDRSAEILDDVVLNSDVVVDRNATLSRAVVLPNSYVGDMVNVDNAIVRGNLMIDLDTGSELSIVDSFLLSDMNQSAVSAPLRAAVDRAIAVVALMVSLPLWPVALLLSLARAPGAPLGSTIRCGIARSGGREFRDYAFATPVPVLRRLPRLLSVIGGRLALSGVDPLTPEEDRGRREEWELVRDRALPGMLGPVQIQLPSGAPLEERLLTDAWYASEQRRAPRLAWILRGVSALFTRRAWRA